MRKLAWVAAVVTLVATGAYVFVYLYRWEWHRALIAGVLFLAAEVAVCTALVLRRLPPASDRPTAGVVHREPGAEPRTEPAGDRGGEFAWLQGGSGFGVFIPVLLGSGVVVSAVAWAVERLAGAGSRESAAQGLAGWLAPLRFPEGLFVEHPEAGSSGTESGADLELLIRPRGSRR